MNETTATLRKLTYVIYQVLSEELIDDLANMPDVEFSQYASFMTGSIAMMIKGQILGREIERIETVYPVDWWQAFKERWFPDWLKSKYPVIYKHEELVARELYPMVKMPEKEPVVALKKRLWTHERDDGDI